MIFTTFFSVILEVLGKGRNGSEQPPLVSQACPRASSQPPLSGKSTPIPAEGLFLEGEQPQASIPPSEGKF